MVPVEHAAQLRSSARAHDRTLAAELRRAVRFYLRELHAQTIVQPPAAAAAQGLQSRVVEHTLAP